VLVKHALPSIEHLWELAVTSEPIVFSSSSPTSCSLAVLATVRFLRLYDVYLMTVTV
jgi:hypothetical protein